jgi:hypothetical protein
MFNGVKDLSLFHLVGMTSEQASITLLWEPENVSASFIAASPPLQPLSIGSSSTSPSLS